MVSSDAVLVSLIPSSILTTAHWGLNRTHNLHTGSCFDEHGLILTVVHITAPLISRKQTKVPPAVANFCQNPERPSTSAWPVTQGRSLVCFSVDIIKVMMVFVIGFDLLVSIPNTFPAVKMHMHSNFNSYLRMNICIYKTNPLEIIVSFGNFQSFPADSLHM